MINKSVMKALAGYAEERIGKDGETVCEALGSVLKAYGEGLTLDGKADTYAGNVDDMNYFHVYSAFNMAELSEEEREEKIRWFLARADKKYLFAGRKLVWLSSKCHELGIGYLLTEKIDRDDAPTCLRVFFASPFCIKLQKKM